MATAVAARSSRPAGLNMDDCRACRDMTLAREKDLLERLGPKLSQDNSNKANSNQEPQKPAEPYDRRKHYGNTPTKADRKATGGESTDHKPPLVQRYYDGDPKKAEKPGYQQTPQERRQSANDRSRMQPATKKEQNKQGGQMSGYSKQKKKEHGFK